jgi:probable HAF family extracellular repeat protein
VVVGWSSTKGKGKNDGPNRAFIWNGGNMVDLNTLMTSGPTVTKPRGINNAGQIIAWSGSTSVLLTPQ